MARKNNNHTGLKIVLIVLMVAFVAASAFLIKLCIDLAEEPLETRPTEITNTLPTRATDPTGTDPTQPTQPEPVHVVSTASVAAQGDLLMHIGVINSGKQTDGSYDYESIFRYMTEYSESYDYTVANLETTFGGDGFPYQGNPAFNCPDALLDSVVEAGYDMLLTANNHSYDTLMTGITRTLEQTRAAGLATLGTRLNEDELRYSIVTVNDIKIGMVCYTYTSGMSDSGKPRLNGNTPVEQPELVNYFSNLNPDKLYNEMKVILEDMKANGAEATMLFIHWGREYELKQNSYQIAQAQKLCDLGVDVIVGGHPHVVQPIELLTSTVDPNHRTICVYSLGNMVSNQRLGNIKDVKTAHTEDGILFSVTFEKYSDGTVYVVDADILPTWVNLSSVNGKLEYNVLPLDYSKKDVWANLFNLTDELYAKAENSYARTMDIAGPGIVQVQEYLLEEKLDRDKHYQELVMDPAA